MGLYGNAIDCRSALRADINFTVSTLPMEWRESIALGDDLDRRRAAEEIAGEIAIAII